MKTIEVTIDKQGNSTVQTRGFSGPSCRQASKAIEKALGITQSDQPTAEMYLAQSQESVQQNSG